MHGMKEMNEQWRYPTSAKIPRRESPKPEMPGRPYKPKHEMPPKPRKPKPELPPKPHRPPK